MSGTTHSIRTLVTTDGDYSVQVDFVEETDEDTVTLAIGLTVEDPGLGIRALAYLSPAEALLIANRLTRAANLALEPGEWSQEAMAITRADS